MIDKAMFNSTYEIFDKEMVKEIIDIYIDEYDDRILTLGKNIHDRDMNALYRNAHSMKGVTANFFDAETEQLARQLEIKGKEEDRSGLEELYEALKKSSSKLVEDLKILALAYSE